MGVLRKIKNPVFLLALSLCLFEGGANAIGSSLPAGFSFSCAPYQPVEAKAGEPAKFSNLGFIQIRAVLTAPADIVIEDFSTDKSDQSFSDPDSDPTNLYISVTPKFKVNKLMTVKIQQQGGGQSLRHKDNLDFYEYSTAAYINIPVSNEIMEKETLDFVELIQPVLIKRARARKQNMTEKELENYLRGYEKEFMKENFQRLYRKHQAGLYEIQCKYSTQSERVWNGALKAEPFIIEVIDDGGFWDKKIKNLKQELEEKKKQEEKKKKINL